MTPAGSARAATTEPVTLDRRLGPIDAAAIVVSNVIGGGILFTPPIIAAGVPHPWLFLSTWVFGGLLAFAGAMAYAELAALKPHAGGEYVYLRSAYGRLAAFLTGWTSFVAGFTGAMAASATVLVFYLDRFIPGVADPAPFFVIPLPFVPLTFSRQTLVAMTAIVLMALVHLRGIGPGRIVSNVLAVLKVTSLLAFIAAGFAFGAASTANLGATAGTITGAGWLMALIPVMFTYSGWNAAAYMAEDMRNPERNIPKALALGTGAVIFIYLLLNVLYLYVMPVGELAKIEGSVLDVIADRLLGASAGDIMGVVSIISLTAGISAYTFAGPRVYYAMARDGLFFPAARQIHPTFRTPTAAIIAQAIWASVLVLSGSAQALTNYTGFAVVLFAGIAVASVFVLRRREPHAPREFKALGYPWAPAIFTLASLAIVANAVYNDLLTPVLRGSTWGPSAAGILIIGAGIPIYWLVNRRKRS
jgi:APA family basic amino acid/polyamine antiporter